MVSASDYLEFVLEQLRKLEGITYIKMMDEYVTYYRRKIFGGIYGSRLLVKDVSQIEVCYLIQNRNSL